MNPSGWNEDPLALETHYQLTQSFKNLRQLLKQNRKKGYFQVERRPWILLLGAPGSGKSSLLAHSELELFSPTQTSKKTVKPTRLLDWWIGEDVVFLDPAGKFACPEAIDTREHFIWKNLLKYCKQYHGNPGIDGVLLVLDAPFFYHLEEKKRESFIQCLSRQLLFINEFNGATSVNLIITQCDRIAGYTDFFADLTTKEQNQTFGFALNENALKSFTQKLETQSQEIVRRVSSKLIWRLHHEQSLIRRMHIKDLPLQFEMVNKQVEQFVTELPWNDTLTLNGIYYCSTGQSAETLNWFALTEILNTNNLPVSASSLSNKNKSLFIHDTLKTIISDTKNFPITPIKNGTATRILGIIIALLVILSSALFWHRGYQESLERLHQVENTLSVTPPTTVVTQTLPWMINLNRLQSTLDELAKNSLSAASWMGLIQSERLHKLIEQQYQQQLISSFQPYLLALLTTQIQLGLKQNDLGLYNVLKTYLMLVDPKRYNRDAVTQWFMFKWRTQYPHDSILQGKLLNHLNALLDLKPLNWPKDTQLIRQAQSALQQLPIANLIFLEMQDKFPALESSIFSQPISGVNLSEATIPELYSSAHFNTIYTQLIPEMVNHLDQGNWVLGNAKIPPINPDQKNKIIQDVRKIYVEFYSNIWLSMLQNINLYPPQTIAQTQQLIEQFTNPQSSFMNLLKIIIGNGQLIEKFGEKSPTQSPSSSAIINLISKSNGDVELKNNLINLKSYLDPINQAADVMKASYGATVLRFQQHGAKDPISDLFNIAKNRPQPIQQWLNTIALSSWNVLLANSRTYINTVWSSTIVPEYNAKIKNKYPIFSQSFDQLNLNDFTHFFGNNGTIQTFFQYVLQPFVNISGNYWTWNALNNKTIGIQQSTLDMLLRASLIQQMFFTDDPNIIGFKFLMLPTAFSTNLVSVTVNLNGQIAVFHGSDQQSQVFNWPGPQSEQVVITFTSSDGKTTTITTEGPWAWFKIIDQTALMTTGNPQIFNLAIQSGDLSATFQLKSDNVMNPFIPGILGSFRCPESL